MSLIDRIRQVTTPLHVATERSFLRTLSLDSVSGYTHALKVFFGFQNPWEQAARACADDAIIRLMETRWRAPDLAADLAYFQIAAADLPTSSHLPSLAGARLLGSLYVMEGSKLGGQQISKVLERALGLTGDLGRSYFKGEGAATAPRWREFLGELMRLSEGRPEPEIIAGASDTFSCLNRWLNESAQRNADAS